MRPLLIIRPEPGCSTSVAAANALGLHAIGAPLFAIEPVEWSLPDLPCDAILAGSANAFRHGGSQLAALRELPVYAVGQTTAEAAAAAGFTVASAGEGGLQVLLDGIAAPLRLLRLAGAERVPLTPPLGIELVERVVYSSDPLPLTQSLTVPTVVALHSAAAARQFGSECDRLGLPRARFTLACIGPRVAEAAGLGWAGVHSANRPDDRALLALAADLCQTPVNQA
jgi:uroporphyrinogen-III synthase